MPMPIILRWKAGFTLKATGWEEMSRRITTIRMERWHFSLPFRWDIHGRILRLDYGYNYPLLEIYDVYVAGDRLSGVLYVDGHMDGPVMLERQY